jgi:hypothetical protein
MRLEKIRTITGIEDSIHFSPEKVSSLVPPCSMMMLMMIFYFVQVLYCIKNGFSFLFQGKFHGETPGHFPAFRGWYLV